MQTKPDDIVFSNDNNNVLTKREFFAAMALKGILVIPNVSIDHAALDATIAADELIKALNLGSRP